MCSLAVLPSLSLFECAINSLEQATPKEQELGSLGMVTAPFYQDAALMAIINHHHLPVQELTPNYVIDGASSLLSMYEENTIIYQKTGRHKMANKQSKQKLALTVIILTHFMKLKPGLFLL